MTTLTLLFYSEKELIAIRRSTYNWLCDFPVMLERPLTSGNLSEHLEFQLPSSCTLCYIVILNEDQIFYNARAHTTCTPRLMWPRNLGKKLNRTPAAVFSFRSNFFIFPLLFSLERISVSMLGRPNLIFENGFNQVGTSQGANNESWRSYYQWLVRNNLYT